MQLSYNLIKNKSEDIVEKKEIKTNYISKAEKEEKIENEKKASHYDIKKSYENLGANIIKKAKNEAESLIMESRRSAFEIEKDA